MGQSVTTMSAPLMLRSSPPILDIVTHAYLEVYESIDQDVSQIQALSIGCNKSKNPKDNVCLVCLKSVHEMAPNLDADLAGRACASVCECRIEHVEMSQKFSVDFGSTTSTDQSFERFQNAIQNNLLVATLNAGGSFNLPKKGSKQETFWINHIKKVHSMVTDREFQASVQTALQEQNLDFRGSAMTITDITTDQAGKIVANAIMGRDAKELAAKKSSPLAELQMQCVAITAPIVEAGLSQTIQWGIVLVALLLSIVGTALAGTKTYAAMKSAVTK